MPRLALPLAVLALAAAVGAPMGAAADSAPASARAMAGNVAQVWAAGVRPSARLGAEPPGDCHRLDDRVTACRIAIVVLARDATGRRPWRCAATALVTRGGQMPARRSGTHCAPFPQPAAVPEPAAALGAAVALNANGDIACLPAGTGRVTCVMTTATRCVGAASIPLRHPSRAVALAAPVCAARRA